MEQLNRDEKRDAALIFFHISFVGGSLFSNMVVGTIASLIGAAAARKCITVGNDHQISVT